MVVRYLFHMPHECADIHGFLVGFWMMHDTEECLALALFETIPEVRECTTDGRKFVYYQLIIHECGNIKRAIHDDLILCILQVLVSSLEEPRLPKGCLLGMECKIQFGIGFAVHHKLRLLLIVLVKLRIRRFMGTQPLDVGNHAPLHRALLVCPLAKGWIRIEKVFQFSLFVSHHRNRRAEGLNE